MTVQLINVAININTIFDISYTNSVLIFTKQWFTVVYICFISCLIIFLTH